MVMSLRSKWTLGWGSVSAYRPNGVRGNKIALRHGYIDQEVSTAERGVLILPSHEELRIDAEAITGGDKIEVHLGESWLRPPSYPSRSFVT